MNKLTRRSETGTPRLRENLFDYFAFDICQAKIPTLILVCQPGVIDAEAMQNCRVQIMNTHWIVRDVVAEIICLPDRHAGLYSAAREPDRETARMMIATVVLRRQSALRVDRAAKLAAPYHQRVIEQPALLQIHESMQPLADLYHDTGWRSVLEGHCAGPSRDEIAV